MIYAKHMKNEEIFDIVDESGNILSRAKRSEVHGNPLLMHQSVHCLLFNSKGELYLQKRSLNKDVQPGKWDTSVGGHVDSGEKIESALYRETYEELCIRPEKFIFLYKYIMRSSIESELVHTFFTVYDGIIIPDLNEISEGKFYKDESISDLVKNNLCTPNFVDEWNRIRELKSTGFQFKIGN